MRPKEVDLELSSHKLYCRSTGGTNYIWGYNQRIMNQVVQVNGSMWQSDDVI